MIAISGPKLAAIRKTTILILRKAKQSSQVVVSAEFVTTQIVKVVERREKWLTNQELPMNTLMDEQQRTEFLNEVKEEYHETVDQKQRQATDKRNKYTKGRTQRWNANASDVQAPRRSSTC